MSNTLGVYNPIFYAQEGLIHLEKALGMAGRIHRGYDEERRSFQKGDTINIRKPSTFTADDAPSTAQDLDTKTVALVLNYWREVKFTLTDKELAIADNPRIINDHIRPAAYALADDIDQKLASLYATIPWFEEWDTTAGAEVANLVNARKILRDNSVPLGDPSMIHGMVGPGVEAKILAASAFTQHQGAGDQGVSDQMRGSLGMKFGVNWFANQNTPTHTPGASADKAGALDGAHSKGATSISVASWETVGTVKRGDTLVIAGNTQRYAVTADATAVAGAITLAITPPLVQDYVDTAVVTGEQDSTNTINNLVFHRNFAALATATLPDHGNELGARIAAIVDPITGLALRSRIWYDGDTSAVRVALDVLYGFTTLDPNLAMRMRSSI
jgi:hypothetical protein